MIEIETIEVSGLTGAIKGLRKPFKNEDTSDSFERNPKALTEDMYWDDEIGKNDLDLCKRLLAAGTDDHSKFMRMIHIQADIRAPLYWWKEMDTYKIATVANSESTMHTIHKKEFSLDDFAHEYLDNMAIHVTWANQDYHDTSYDCLRDIVGVLNGLRELYLHAMQVNDPDAKRIWYQMIQLLPTSYMQKRTWDANYATLRRIYFSRRGHKLSEWKDFCIWMMTLPYGEELITYVAK